MVVLEDRVVDRIFSSFGREVNLGGLHFAQGREAVLPYVYLSRDERAALEQLVAEGAEVVARDLPGARRVPADRLLSRDGDGE